ncbi:MAG: COX15/CtaA family protein, partial [Burkholderiaceae bacterium]
MNVVSNTTKVGQPTGISDSQRSRFFWVGLVTVVAVYFLILVGGTVRATGAGMGCPDWPL